MSGQVWGWWVWTWGRADVACCDGPQSAVPWHTRCLMPPIHPLLHRELQWGLLLTLRLDVSHPLFLPVLLLEARMHVPQLVAPQPCLPLVVPTLTYVVHDSSIRFRQFWGPSVVPTHCVSLPRRIWHSKIWWLGLLLWSLLVIYYEQQIKRELQWIHICGCRYNERLEAKSDGSMWLTHTGFVYYEEIKRDLNRRHIRVSV